MLEGSEANQTRHLALLMKNAAALQEEGKRRGFALQSPSVAVHKATFSTDHKMSRVLSNDADLLLGSNPGANPI